MINQWTTVSDLQVFNIPHLFKKVSMYIFLSNQQLVIDQVFIDLAMTHMALYLPVEAMENEEMANLSNTKVSHALGWLCTSSSPETHLVYSIQQEPGGELANLSRRSLSANSPRVQSFRRMKLWLILSIVLILAEGQLFVHNCTWIREKGLAVPVNLRHWCLWHSHAHINIIWSP